MQSTEDEAFERLDRSLSAEAFRSLPARWQEALWYSEIEQMRPRHIAQIFSITPAAARTLIFRARDGLRQAWIQGHLKRLDEDSPHRWVIEHLGAYSMGATSPRDTARIEDHLASCARCTVVASEADNLGEWLSIAVLPIFVGIGVAARYTQQVRDGATSPTASPSGPMPRSVTHKPSGSGFSSGPRPGREDSAMLGAHAFATMRNTLAKKPLVTSALGTLLVAGLAVGISVPLGVFSAPEPEQPTAALPLVTTSVPSTHPLTARLLTQSKLFLPQLSGTATPGGTVTISLAGKTLSQVQVDHNGVWTTEQLAVSEDHGTLTAQEDAASGTSTAIDVDFELEVPSVKVVLSPDGRSRSVTVTGVPTAPIDVFNVSTGNGSLAATNLDANGVWSATFAVDEESAALPISVRYGAGLRYGLLVTG